VAQEQDKSREIMVVVDNTFFFHFPRKTRQKKTNKQKGTAFSFKLNDQDQMLTNRFD